MKNSTSKFCCVTAKQNQSVIGHCLVCFPSLKRRQRDQLLVWVQEQRKELGPNHEDEELLQTEQCLDEVSRIKHRLPCVGLHMVIVGRL